MQMEWELVFVWKCEKQMIVLVEWFGKKACEQYQYESKQGYQKKVVQNYLCQKILNGNVGQRPCLSPLSSLPYSSFLSWPSSSSCAHHFLLISSFFSSFRTHHQEHREDHQSRN